MVLELGGGVFVRKDTESRRLHEPGTVYEAVLSWWRDIVVMAVKPFYHEIE